MVAFVVGLVITGIHSLFRLHPSCRQGQVRHTFMLWILPGLTVLTSGVLLARTESIQTWLLSMIGGIVLLGVVITIEFRSLDSAELAQPQAQLSATVFIYLLAFILLMLVYATRARTLLVAPLTFVVSALLAMRFFWNRVQQLGRVVLYGGVVGLVMGQVVWALNYWRITPISGGVVLLLLFYSATGITQQLLLGRMSRRVLLEYVVVALVAAAIILGLLA
jgi:hypothetical protein